MFAVLVSHVLRTCVNLLQCFIILLIVVIDMRTDLKPSQQPVSEDFSADKVKVSVEGDAAKDVDLLTLEDIRDQIRYVEKAVATKELHFMTRVLRGIVPIRRKLNSNVLRGLVYTYFTPQSQQWNYFMEFLPEVKLACPDYLCI